MAGCKAWFITGASRGFVAEMTEDALARGDRVVATTRNSGTVAEVVGEHPHLLAVKLDVTNEAEAHQAGRPRRRTSWASS